MMSRNLIGVDPNPTEPGSYNIDIEGIMACCAIYAEFDGEKWHIPEYYVEDKDGKVWWYD